ncbi:hypothetical protein EMGBD2_01300 [Nitrospirota bacterium]|nr:hypothetical protein EMGBD2_01300 [Nitrospirota bacterium]
MTAGGPSWNAQNPAFYLRHCALGWCQVRIQTCGKTVVPVGAGKPRGNAEGVMLIRCAIVYCELTTPQRRIGFGDSRMPSLHVPPVKRPEVNARAKVVTHVAQPRDARVGGFRHRTLYIEMENRLRTTRTLLGQATPASVPHPGRAVSPYPVTHELDVNVLVGGPVPLKIIEKLVPVRRQMVNLEIAQRKRESVVDADKRGGVLAQPRHKPFGNPAPGPVFARRCRREYFTRRVIAFCHVDTQAF